MAASRDVTVLGPASRDVTVLEPASRDGTTTGAASRDQVMEITQSGQEVAVGVRCACAFVLILLLA